MRKLLVMALVLLGVPAWCAPPSIPLDLALVDRLRERALTRQLGAGWLKRICRPGGRLTGSPGLEQALFEAERIMREAGFQNIRRQPVDVPGWRPGKATLHVTVPGDRADMVLAVAALGRSVPTSPEGIEGPLVVVDSLEELLSEKPDVQGAVVLINAPFPDGVANTFAGYSKLAGGRMLGSDTVREAGARAVLVRSITTRPDKVPHLGTLIYAGDERIPGATISVVDAVRLAELSNKHTHVRVCLRMTCEPAPDVRSWNLMGEIAGATHPEDVVLLGAHIDSWNAGHGAHDNGAGCVHVLEALSLLLREGLRPARTIRCILFVSEEYGSHGAEAYADWQNGQRENLIATLESDRGGFVPRGFYVDGSDSQIATLRGWLPIFNRVSIDWFRKGGSGADTGHLDMAGIRVGLAVDSQRYFDLHHSANDTVDQVHSRELELGSAALAALAYALSEGGPLE